MRGSILPILSGLRRRLLLVRAVEAGAVGGAAGGLTAAALMAGWILAGPFILISAVICAIPAGAGLAFAASKRLRERLHDRQVIQWFVTIGLIACGFAGLVCVLTGTYIHLPKNLLFLIFPSVAFLAFVIALIRGSALRDVAVLVDRRAGLRERLSTALELIEVGEPEAGSTFARAVRNQALIAADRRDLRRVGFWNRTRATGGALGLAIIASLLMLAVDPIESPAARRQRQWQKISRQASESIRRQLAAIESQTLITDATTSEQIHRLEELAGLLGAASPEQAEHWQGRIVELNEISDVLRRILRSGGLDAKSAGRIERLIDALDQVAAGIAEGMSENAGPEYALSGSPTDGTTPGYVEGPNFTTTRPAESSWESLTVYNPRYAAEAATATSPAGNGDAGAPPKVQIPYDKAWADARRRASDVVERGSIPAEYRRLIRDFFDAER